MPPRVLCLLTDGFEEIETVTPVDLLRRAGAEVVMASLGESLTITGRSGIVLHADTLLASIEAEAIDFDLLFIPGGPAVKAMRADGRPAHLARSYFEAQKPIAAICAAPLILQDAGLLKGTRHTAHNSTYGELIHADPEEEVIVDGLITTSRGAGTALRFGLQLVTQLFGTETAQQVAKAIMV